MRRRAVAHLGGDLERVEVREGGAGAGRNEAAEAEHRSLGDI